MEKKINVFKIKFVVRYIFFISFFLAIFFIFFQKIGGSKDNNIYTFIFGEESWRREKEIIFDINREKNTKFVIEIEYTNKFKYQNINFDLKIISNKDGKIILDDEKNIQLFDSKSGLPIGKKSYFKDGIRTRFSIVRNDKDIGLGAGYTVILKNKMREESTIGISCIKILNK